jgi:putative FmdB family regulatory protein|tara:strand:+ start:348 stop:593 length:246 start_codon:yes stop_codon:yes gene_type:complete
MPRYIYFCESCQVDFTVFHGMNDIQTMCIECESDKIKKMLTRPIHLSKKKEKSTGNLTKKYIEENREILEDLKKESKNNHD